MMVIGITGGIGSGKSTAAEYLVSLGFACVDADQIGRDITAAGSPVLDVLNREFGPEGKFGNGSIILSREETSGKNVLNRKALADVVFGDEKARKHFDSIIHEKILRIIEEQIERLKHEDSVRGILLDAPLMYEAGCDSMCDVVILVTANMDTRIKRVIERDNTTEDDVRSRIASQMSDSSKAALADFVVDNSASLQELQKKLDDILAEIDKNS